MYQYWLNKREKEINNFSKNSTTTIASNRLGAWGRLSWAGARAFCKSGASMWTLKIIASARSFWVTRDGPAPGLAPFSAWSMWNHSCNKTPIDNRVFFSPTTQVFSKIVILLLLKKTPHNGLLWSQIEFWPQKTNPQSAWQCTCPRSAMRPAHFLGLFLGARATSQPPPFFSVFFLGAGARTWAGSTGEALLCLGPRVTRG